jgi:hypothetical protein
MAAAGAVGLARGISQGLASARTRRLEEEDRKREEEDRQREIRYETEDRSNAAIDRGRRRTMDDLTLDEARHRADRRDEDDTFEDRSRAQTVESGDLNLASARRREAYAAPDREHELATRDTQEQRDRFSLSRDRTEAGQQDADRNLDQDTQTSSNLAGIFYGLKQGMDPDMLRERFNSLSPKKLDEITYDAATGIVSITDQDGEERSGPLEQFMQVYPVPKEELIKLGKDDRLIDPRTRQTVVAPAGDTGDGRDTSPYNPETVGGQLRGDIVRSAGGQLGPLGEIMGIADPDARKLVDFQVAQATAMEGRLRPHIMAGRIGTGDVSNAVVEATKDIPSDTELARRAEEWRTTGINKTPEQAAAWADSERIKAQAEATQRLLEGEQALLGANPSPRMQKPAWAGEAVEGVDPETIWPGGFGPNGEADEVDVEIDGRKTTIRLGPDGKVYEVAGSPQASVRPARATQHRMAGDDPVAQQVNATLADARRNSKPFLYS